MSYHSMTNGHAAALDATSRPIRLDDLIPPNHATGPKTEAGKAQSRRNALKHGLSGHGVVLPDELAEQIHDRKEFWRKDYRPDGPAQEWYFERICVESVLADRCLHLQIDALDDLAQRASESWDDDRQLAAAELMEQLNKRPEIVQKRLIQTAQGCDVLIAAWQEVAETFRKYNGWEMHTTWPRVLDLLGIAIDQRTERTPSLLGDAQCSPAGQNWIDQQIAELQRRKTDYLDDRNERERGDTEAGLVDDAPSLRRLQRYEAAILRRMQWALKQLRALQTGPRPEPTPRPDPAPTRDPDSRPDRAPDSGPARVSSPSPTPAPTLSAKPLSTVLNNLLPTRSSTTSENRSTRRARLARHRRAG
ncbi:hypothetical protein BH23PLA1_BH23PLA1_34280 [soil metagenome]